MKLIVPDDHVDCCMEFDPAQLCAKQVSLVINMVDMIILDDRKDAAQISYNASLPAVMNIAVSDDVRTDRFFAPSEVSEIWLTFPDPQMKKVTKRLTSTDFLLRYRRFMKDGGVIHLKTDSNFMFTYTRLLVELNMLPLKAMTNDLYHSGLVDNVLSIRTYYEQQWLDRGITIKYISFALPQEGDLQEPDVEIELDDYRSYNRSKRSSLQVSK